jgi:hypothetical protein
MKTVIWYDKETGFIQGSMEVPDDRVDQTLPIYAVAKGQGSVEKIVLDTEDPVAKELSDPTNPLQLHHLRFDVNEKALKKRPEEEIKEEIRAHAEIHEQKKQEGEEMMRKLNNKEGTLEERFEMALELLKRNRIIDRTIK